MTGPRGAECQCVRCGSIFTSETSWRLHQRPDSGCLDAAALGLVLVPQYGHDAWQLPGREAGGDRPVRAARKALLATLSTRSRRCDTTSEASPSALDESPDPLDGVRLGDRVRLHREDDVARGTWSRYEGRTGTVVALNLEDQELCVRGQFGEAWFRTHEWRAEALARPYGLAAAASSAYAP